MRFLSTLVKYVNWSMGSNTVKAWIEAFRLRTLPLALSCIGMGAFLAASDGLFKWAIFVFSCLTTLFLQILSNLANDYGDAVSGVDSEHREGPTRAVQTGAISKEAMKKSLYVFSGLSFISGIILLGVSFREQWVLIGVFVLLGLSAIYAAIKYTSGKNPYGYVGLGDLSVFLFFGLIGVSGSYFLYSQSFNYSTILPSITCGFFAVAVLNLNNIRDIQSDKEAGKRSIPVRIGREKAVIYHWFLLLGGFLAAIAYIILNYRSPWQYAILITLPLLIKNAMAVYHKKEAMQLDPYLKQMAISTLIFVLIFGLSQILVV